MGPVVTDSINHSQSAATTGMSAGSLCAHFVSPGVKVCLFGTHNKIFQVRNHVAAI